MTDNVLMWTLNPINSLANTMPMRAVQRWQLLKIKTSNDHARVGSASYRHLEIGITLFIC